MEIFELIMYWICTTIRLLVSAMESAIFLRAILSWFVGEDSLILRILYAFTEPVIAPVRSLLSRFGVGDGDMPIDFAPLVTMILLMIVGMFLPVITL